MAKDNKTNPAEATGTDKLKRVDHDKLALSGFNFLLMAVSGALIVIGFLLMGGSSSTIEAYNPEIFSARRIIVGPAIAFIGFVAMAVAIIVKPRKR